MVGAALPILVFAAGAAWLGFSGAPDERGLWPVLVVALGAGLLLARRASDYSAAALSGMSRPIVMLMVAAWLLAGIFSAVLRESGLVHSLVWAGAELGVSGGGFVLLAFLIAVLFSTATGTSLGTILICAPLLYPAAGVFGASPVALIGAILAGATFGDNVSPVSDTTIASATTQDAPMGGVVRSRLRYALPAALGAAVILVLLGGAEAPPVAEPVPGAALTGDPSALPMLLAPVAAFLMLWRGARPGGEPFRRGGRSGGPGPDARARHPRRPDPHRRRILPGPRAHSGRDGGRGRYRDLHHPPHGIVGAAQEAGIVDRLAGARGPWRAAPTARGVEFGIFAVTSAAVMLTTHSVMAILAVGDLVRDSGRRAGVGRFRRANLLDMTVCTYPFLLPFFIPTILAASATASGEAFGVPRVSALEAGLANAYSWALLGVILVAIATGLGRSEDRSDATAR